MTKIVRIVVSAVLFQLLIVLPPSSVQAQTCAGDGFVAINVLDSDGKAIPAVTIELIAEVSHDEHEEIYRKAPIKVLGGWGTAVKVSTQTAKNILKKAAPMGRNEDFCGKPLKLRIHSPEVTLDNMRKPGKFVFSFCAIEVWGQSYLLKISAPGYVSDYYLGPFLNGCGSIYNFVLCKKD